MVKHDEHQGDHEADEQPPETTAGRRQPERLEGRAQDARDVSSRHILYVQEVLEEVRQEVQRVARAERRNGR